ncbi:MAG: NTP transferase domain-containing protein [Fibrobacter sp.]|jgi:glucose-1-phosphate thymidylyltransferase|nr:NTP transferase domain-containing protein [Fibrobacter sp.]
MKLILPVAGVGTRLRPFTLTKPKCLLPVAGMTVLDHILGYFKDYEISETILITGYKSEAVDEFLKTREFKNMRTVLQKNPQGLGEAISLCLPFLNDDEPVLIVLGDTLFEADFSFLKDSEESVLMTRVVEDPRRFGVVVKGEDGIISRLVEKPQEFVSNEALVGIYYIKDIAALRRSLNTLISENIRTRGEYQLTDALQNMVDSGVRFKTKPLAEWLDCGTSEAFIETNEFVLKKMNVPVGKSYPDSKIIPPCYFGKNVAIENSTIGPNVSIGDNCTVTGSELSDCILDHGTFVKSSALQKSVLGESAIVEGVKGKLYLGDYSLISAQGEGS